MELFIGQEVIADNKKAYISGYNPIQKKYIVEFRDEGKEQSTKEYEVSEIKLPGGKAPELFEEPMPPLPPVSTPPPVISDKKKKRKQVETAQETLIRLSQREEGVTIAELMKERGGSTIGPYYKTFQCALEDKWLVDTKSMRDDCRVFKYTNPPVVKNTAMQDNSKDVNIKLRLPKGEGVSSEDFANLLEDVSRLLYTVSEALRKM